MCWSCGTYGGRVWQWRRVEAFPVCASGLLVSLASCFGLLAGGGAKQELIVYGLVSRGGAEEGVGGGGGGGAQEGGRFTAPLDARLELVVGFAGHVEDVGLA